MKLQRFYQEIIQKGIEQDVRSRKAIEALLKKNKKAYEDLSTKEKRLFDVDTFFNPYADTRILCGDPQDDIRSIIVGIDVEGPELLLVDRLNQKGKKIDCVVAHHPEGHAYANFYDVMDLQTDIFSFEGVSLSASQNLLNERKAEVARRVSAANHGRSVDIARLLGINFLCMHTPCDNCAYRFLQKTLEKQQPKTLGDLMDILLSIPEYVEAAKHSNPPQIVVGAKNSRCKKIHLEFTGGTEGPKSIYEKLSAQGIDTVVAMHQSEEHFKKCKDANINVIFASHIASDNIGINIMLDHLERKGHLEVYEFSGFKRVRRSLKK